MKLCILASGSSGNCTFLSTGTTRILIDAGISAKRTTERLAEIGERVEDIDAICVTHEHGDHIAGLRVLQKKHGMPIYANAGTVDGIRNARLGGDLEFCQFTTGSRFEIGDMAIEPFGISHDSAEPVGFLTEAGDHTVGFATDIGIVTNVLREKLRRCNVVVLEANHDEGMVQTADRPWRLKQRILGNQGHLSNRASAGLIAEVGSEQLTHLFLAHLSGDCNCPSQALSHFEETLQAADCGHVNIYMSGASKVSEILEMG